MGSAGDPVPVALALGSNLGDRARHLRDAASALSSHIESLKLSTFYETEPVGVGSQPRFLNAAASGLTRKSAADLLDAMFAIESRLGRTRPFPGAARTIDLDLILYGGETIDTPTLTVPHPRFRERHFVLAPLAEVAGDWIDPLTGRSVTELLLGIGGR